MNVDPHKQCYYCGVTAAKEIKAPWLCAKCHKSIKKILDESKKTRGF